MILLRLLITIFTLCYPSRVAPVVHLDTLHIHQAWIPVLASSVLHSDPFVVELLYAYTVISQGVKYASSSIEGGQEAEHSSPLPHGT